MISNRRCHKQSSCSALPRRVSQSWVLSRKRYLYAVFWALRDLQSSAISPEFLWTTRGLALAGSAGTKMYESSSLVYLESLFRENRKTSKNKTPTCSDVRESTSWWIVLKRWYTCEQQGTAVMNARHLGVSHAQNETHTRTTHAGPVHSESNQRAPARPSW